MTACCLSGRHVSFLVKCVEIVLNPKLELPDVITPFWCRQKWDRVLALVHQKFDPVLRHLARDVRVDPHDAVIRVADPRTENRFFDPFAAAS